MRLLLVVEEVSLGGAELSFLELAKALASRCEVHLVMGEASARRYAATPVFQLLQRSATLHLCPGRLNPGTLSLLISPLRRAPARQVSRLVDTLRPDAVIVNLPTVERGQSIVDGVRRSQSRPPVWGFLHLTHPPTTLGAKLGVIRNLGVRKLLRRFDRLLTVSRHGSRQILERYGLGPPDIVYPPTTVLQPVTDPATRDRQRAEAGLPQGFLLGVVGRVQLRHKGQDTALRVLARLLEAGHHTRLVVIGDGPDLSTLRRQAEELRVDPQVSFLGWRNDVEKLIPLLDAVLMPSRFEGLPQTALQSATARVPVVGYAVDGLAELLPPEFQVRFGDETALAATVAGLLTGVLRWPFQELEERASTWGSPTAAAERLLRLLANDAVSSPSDSESAGLPQDAAGIQESLPRKV